jgi:hypothetical protein
MAEKKVCEVPSGNIPYGDPCVLEVEMFKEWPVCMMVGGGLLVLGNVLMLVMYLRKGRMEKQDTVEVHFDQDVNSPKKRPGEIMALTFLCQVAGSAIFLAGLIGSIVIGFTDPLPTYKKYPCHVGPGEGANSLIVTERNKYYGQRADCSKVVCEEKNKYCSVL